MLKRLFDRAFRRGKATSAAVSEAQAASAAIAVPTKLEIVRREQHIISRRNISPNALRVLYKLREGGYAAYLVGGAVRDLLLGGHPKDFDVATDAHPDQVRSLFRNCRLIGRRFRLAHVHYGQEIIEVATFRGSADDGSGARELVDGRIVRDNVYGTIEEDAVRRDFTINALYYAVEDFSVRDYVGGYRDVQDRVLRLIGDPERRFREDPVRMLRAARFAAKLGFVIEPKALAAMGKLKQLIADAPPARLFDESLKLFLAGHALQSFRMLREYDLLNTLLPNFTSAMVRDPSTLHMIEAALRSTDERIRDGKTVTPAFLFAALLWPALQEAMARRAERGDNEDWLGASQDVITAQIARNALPKRISLPMQEIWLLQPRLDARQRKRSSRLLGHPRIRAAFDFLALRALADAELRDTVTFWSALYDGMVPSPPVEPELVDDDTTAPAQATKKRRRRRRKPGSGDNTANTPLAPLKN
ncbi:MAG: polynucleotide adenylyltransferase PcnB [Pseudomonadota bacterium]|nr:polynucleotide adenylyltransferase PcnB [Pseudomonadota bacterium]